MCRVMLDLDDVIYPWSATAHAICEKAGITGGNKITQWEFWRDYGVSPETLWDTLDEATTTGTLYYADPIPGALDGVTELLGDGFDVRVVTARGVKGNNTGLIRDYTHDWMRWYLPGVPVQFEKDKPNAGRFDYALDDGVHNYRALDDAAVQVWLMDAVHNKDALVRRRLFDLPTFARIVAETERRLFRADQRAV